MNVYVWQRVAQCSTNWHPEGGVVVFANTESEARELAAQNKGCCIGDDEAPDRVEVLANPDASSGVFIMADAGCC